MYLPGIAKGMIITAGRWIATPDIETQFAPDNYMGTHSLLFTIDVYTETGVMATVMLNDQWTVQAAIHAGADMAPWYQGAVPTGMFGVRWVSCDNKWGYLWMRDLFEAIQGRFDAGVVVADAKKRSSVIEDPAGTFLGFEVADIDVIRFARTAAAAAPVNQRILRATQRGGSEVRPV